MKHKWYNEIVAWASGVEIQYRGKDGKWFNLIDDNPEWDYFEYRIKPQPKEPQYLYVFRTSSNGQTEYKLWHDEDTGGAYMGKIKLEE
jgi:hypothetical protein